MGEHRGAFRGYIAMLVVIKPYRGKGIATELVTRSIQVMRESGCEEPKSDFGFHLQHLFMCIKKMFQVALEAEVTNKGALALYGRLGFIRAKRLFRYYLNGVDAFRLKLLFPHRDPSMLRASTGYNSHVHPSQHSQEFPQSNTDFKVRGTSINE
ncbi:N-alpha-acetyltransferase MAK3 [Asparagus officinalis]|nr:N-alpha-acetyltransferase MAK3 [Asparagus officinalis]